MLTALCLLAGQGIIGAFDTRLRKPLRDVFGGERVRHAVMSIIYGAAVANLLPALVDDRGHGAVFDGLGIRLRRSRRPTELC